MGKQSAKTRSNPGKQPPRRTPSRLAKSRLVERLREDTKEIRTGSLSRMLRKQGYEEIPLDELQDRLSRLRTPLGELILAERG